MSESAAVSVPPVLQNLHELPGPSCSKLMMPLVNESLKLIIKYGIYANIFAEKM